MRQLKDYIKWVVIPIAVIIGVVWFMVHQQSKAIDEVAFMSWQRGYIEGRLSSDYAMDVAYRRDSANFVGDLQVVK